MWILACIHAKAVVPIDSSLLSLVGVNSVSTGLLRYIERKDQP